LAGRIYYIIVSGVCVLFFACSATRYVPDGDYLYKGATVKVQSKEVSMAKSRVLSEELESLLRPKPNRDVLGIPFRLLIYSFWGTPGREKGIGNWISRKAGEEPVLLSDVRREYQRDLLRNRLENRGYFHAEVERDSNVHGRKMKLIYRVDPGVQYVIDTVYFPADSSVLAKAVRATARRSFLRKNDPFDLDVIKAERDRIDARLKEQGFYYFNADHILVLADTTSNTNTVKLSVTIKQSTPARAQQKFTIDSILIFPKHSLSRDTARQGPSVTQGDLVIFDSEETYRQRLFERVMVFRRGDIYNRTSHNRTLNRLIELGVFKYVDNKFLESGDTLLNVYYYLTPFPKKSLRIEISGRNTSTNFNGAEINLSWQNRNAFRGAEHLRIHVYGGADVQISGVSSDNNVFRYGAEANLNIPRFVTPFKVITPSAYIPRTRVTIGYDRLDRVASYVLNSFRASFGYKWKESIKKEHQFNIFSVNYIQPSRITSAYAERLMMDPTLANAIQRQFIIGPNYNYIVTNTMEKNRKHTMYYNALLDLSGNLLGILSGANFRNGETRQIFNADFAQYIKMEHDMRYYNNLGRGSAFAARGFVGIGYAYGNSSALPFVKQFFAGGTTGLRAFRARSLGPGTYRAEGIDDRTILTADQTGDIKIEMSVEYRPKISGILKGAIFLDAGNIWLLREDPTRAGAAWSGNFLDELAVGFGFGLRLDLSFFVLRGDLAFPLRKPWYPESSRWVFNEIDPGSKAWRRENLVFNLAIGYPF
jgi:outer membrane protein insertion porin family